MAWPPADRLYANIAKRSRLARLIALQSWSRLDGSGDWLAQWQQQLPRVLVATYAAQTSAAQLADAGSVAGLLEQGWTGETIDRLAPASLAGWMEPDDSPYPVPLKAALGTAPVIASRTATGATSQRLAAGANLVDSLVQAAVSHSGRMAVQVGSHGRTKTLLAFYEPGKACQRCAVLVGKIAGMHENFKRHPRCDGICVEVPRGGKVPFDPLDLGDITDLTDAQKQAIDEGADVNQVINSHSNLSADRLTTGSGRGPDRGARLTPRAIYAQAGGDREKARQLLRAHGYLL